MSPSSPVWLFSFAQSDMEKPFSLSIFWASELGNAASSRVSAGVGSRAYGRAPPVHKSERGGEFQSKSILSSPLGCLSQFKFLSPFSD